jgi:hypothetical protein
VQVKRVVMQALPDRGPVVPCTGIAAAPPRPALPCPAGHGRHAGRRRTCCTGACTTTR